MADLTAHEKEVIEDLFEMKKSTVLDMDKEEFLFFINKYIDIDLDNFEEYQDLGSASLFRKMWDIETNYTISITLKYLLEWYLKHKYYEVDEDYSENFEDTYYFKKMNQYSKCKTIEENLMFKDF